MFCPRKRFYISYIYLKVNIDTFITSRSQQSLRKLFLKTLQNIKLNSSKINLCLNSLEHSFKHY